MTKDELDQQLRAAGKYLDRRSIAYVAIHREATRDRRNTIRFAVVGVVVVVVLAAVFGLAVVRNEVTRTETALDVTHSGPAGDRPTANESSSSIPVITESAYSAPDHSRLQFTQDLVLFCEGLETVDNGGFDSFVMDIWIDPNAGYARLGVDYPDGSTYDIILQGHPGDWSQAWGSGTDLGRNAGCRQTLEDGGYEQSIAGWAFLDSSPLFFEGYLRPVTFADGGIIVDEWRGLATLNDSNVYITEEVAPSGARHDVEYILDQSGNRLAHEERFGLTQALFEERGTIEVVEAGPATLPIDIFDTSTFVPLWGGGATTTTEATG